MLYRKVNKVLLVGTKYHSYILSEIGYQNIKQYPDAQKAYYYADSMQEAVDILNKKDIDMVQFDFSIDEELPNELSKFVKSLKKQIACVLLTTRQSFYYKKCGTNKTISKGIDYVFIWTGNSQLLKTIIRLVEDTYNREFLIKEKKLNAVLVTEDEPIFYSKFLPILYNELIGLAANVSGNSDIDALEKFRPRVLLANTYEEAETFMNEYGEFLIGVVSDIRFPKNNEIYDDAGIELAKAVKQYRENIPVLLQSKEKEERERALASDAYFLWKDSDLFLRKLRTFILNYFGFGDFIFRLPSGAEVARASDVQELYELVKTVSRKSLLYHGKKHHFSSWLNIHGYPKTARKLYSISPKNLTGDEIRQFLLTELEPSSKNESTKDIKTKSLEA